MSRSPRPATRSPLPREATSRRGALALLLAAPLALGCSSSQLLSAGQAPVTPLAALDQDGTSRSLEGQLGRPVVVFFYPADESPGCTAEACAFRDAWGRYTEAGVMVFGVSGDTQESKASFAEKEKLPFPILADPEHTWARAFGVGSTLGMMDRVSFLIDAQGKVAKVYPDVDPGIHADEVLADARKLGLVR